MNNKGKLITLLLVAILLLTACDEENNNGANGINEAGSADLAAGNNDLNDSEVDQEIDEADQGTMQEWLQQLNNGEIAPVQMDDTLHWGLGYFLYYADLDAINALGIDNMIYFALEARRRLDTGEVTAETMTLNDRNLLEMTDGLLYDPNQPLTEQVAQNEEVRQAILDRIVEDQSDLSPEEALESGQIVGVFGPPAGNSVGGKYLVYTQDSPGGEFEFLGVIMAVDAAGGTQETYNHNDWNDLAWLGDAAGPFWDDLPVGISGDPANTGEARPGVLLVNEEIYRDITGEDDE